MRIHTSLTWRDLSSAIEYARQGRHGNVWFGGPLYAKEFGSRSRPRAFDVKLEGDGTVSRQRINQGTAKYRLAGEDLPFAATYDQWGWFLAHLFVADPLAHCWAYSSLEDFHAKTHGKYTTIVRHRRHLAFEVVPHDTLVPA